MKDNLESKLFPLKVSMMIDMVKEQFEKFGAESPDLYQHLNSYTAWFNEAVVNYEIFLEDNWFDDKTTIEYTLRSMDTFNMLVFAEDEYRNSKDDKGVMHLGEYVKTYWILENPWEAICNFIQDNGAVRYK